MRFALVRGSCGRGGGLGGRWGIRFGLLGWWFGCLFRLLSVGVLGGLFKRTLLATSGSNLNFFGLLFSLLCWLLGFGWLLGLGRLSGGLFGLLGGFGGGHRSSVCFSRREVF